MAEFPPPSLAPLAQEVVDLLKARNETVSVAETAAGGLISACLLSIPGASAIYKGGLTVYTLEARLAFAGWTQANIENYAGPTTEIVSQMAEHTRQTLFSTYAVSESGTAGPTGGSTRNRTPYVLLTHSSGYVAIAVSGAHGCSTREVETGSSNRAENMVSFARETLQLLKEVLAKTEGSAL